MPKLTSRETAAHFFPSFKNPDFLFHFFDFLEEYLLGCLKFEFIISIIGLFLTIFHIFILTRKPMMTSSIMSIMIGIGICDSISMIIAISIKNIIFSFYRDECTPPSTTLLTYHIFWMLQYFRADVIRCSTWLGVLMALIRFLALRFVTKPKFQKISSISFGFYAFLTCFMLSSGISFFHFSSTRIVDSGLWVPPEKCGIENIEKWSIYILEPSDFFNYFDGFFIRLFIFLNGFLSRILPCALLPVTTVLLILEIRKTRGTSSTTSFMIRKRTDRTTALVIFMAVTFFIASLPAGIFTLFQVMYTDPGLLHLSIFVDHVCNAILTGNASIHCFICFIMSSDYRKTVKTILRILPKRIYANSS